MKRLAALATLALLATACGGGGSGDSGTVRVAHVPTTLFAPLYVAEVKGYFADEGVEIELETVKAGQDAIPLAASAEVDAVVAGFSAGMFNALDQDLEIEIVGSMGASDGESPGPSALMVDKKLVDSDEIKSPADLRGRKVGIAGGAGAAGGYQIDTILRQHDLNLDDIQVTNVSFPDMQTAIEGGSVAAAYPPAPFTTQMVDDGAAVELEVPPPGTTATGVIFGDEFVGTDDSAAFFRALQHGSRDLQGDGAESEENLKILAEATGQDLAVLREVPPYTFAPDLAPDTEQLQAQQRTYLDAGLLDYDQMIPADDYVDTSVAGR